MDKTFGLMLNSFSLESVLDFVESARAAIFVVVILKVQTSGYQQQNHIMLGLSNNRMTLL